MKYKELVLKDIPLDLNEWKKKLLIHFFSKLEEGHLIVTENGNLVGEFGNHQSDLKAEIEILKPSFYSKFLFGGSIGAGESYINQEWQSSNLVNVIRVFLRNYKTLDEIEKKYTWISRIGNHVIHKQRKNSKTQAKQNISDHYDLGNELYSIFLDNKMMYSSGIYKNGNENLNEAQELKLNAICEKLQLSAKDHVVEIGTGWGGLAIYMAQNYGCQVTTTTISDEQYQYTKRKVKELNLENKIKLLNCDYRELTSSYDKLVSIEMIEAVGKEYINEFIKKCSYLLKDNGVMLIQSINILDQRLKSYSQNVDFIQKHIFPGGFLPSLTLLSDKFTKLTDLVIRDVHDIGLDYAQTLQDWHINFKNNFYKIRNDGYDLRFYRLWEFYLNSCEAGFLERNCSATQILLTKRDHLGKISRI